MRVLHVSPYFAPAFVYGGPPRSILGLCQALQRAGVAVEVMTTTANGGADHPATVGGSDEFGGIRVRYFRRTVPRGFWNGAGLRQALTSLAGPGRPFDLVHIHGLWHIPGWLAAHAARRAATPYVVSPRGMLEPGALAIHGLRKRLAFYAIERRDLERAALLHATSSAEAESIADQRLGTPVSTIPNGVTLPTLSVPDPVRARTRFGIEAGDRVLVFLGRIHPIKRLDLLAAALGLLSRTDVRVVVAGPDEGGHRARVEPLFEAARVRVTWAGPVDDSDKQALLAGASCLVQCSDSESFGLSAAEAMAAGVPVVVTHTCPWPDIEPAGAGFWVPQEPRAIAGALDAVFQDPAGAACMGARGRKLIESRYAWDVVGQSMARAYEGVLAGRVRIPSPQSPVPSPQRAGSLS